MNLQTLLQLQIIKCKLSRTIKSHRIPRGRQANVVSMFIPSLECKFGRTMMAHIIARGGKANTIGLFIWPSLVGL